MLSSINGAGNADSLSELTRRVPPLSLPPLEPALKDRSAYLNIYRKVFEPPPKQNKTMGDETALTKEQDGPPIEQDGRIGGPSCPQEGLLCFHFHRSEAAAAPAFRLRPSLRSYRWGGGETAARHARYSIGARIARAASGPTVPGRPNAGRPTPFRARKAGGRGSTPDDAPACRRGRAAARTWTRTRARSLGLPLRRPSGSAGRARAPQQSGRCDRRLSHGRAGRLRVPAGGTLSPRSRGSRAVAPARARAGSGRASD
jgi:hypothetical protein